MLAGQKKRINTTDTPLQGQRGARQVTDITLAGLMQEQKRVTYNSRLRIKYENKM